MSRLGGVGARLSLALLLVVALALGLVYLVVVPSLEERLVDAKVSQAKADANRVAGAIVRSPFHERVVVDEMAANVGGRIVLFEPFSQGELSRVHDTGDTPAVDDDPIARRAAETLRFEGGTVERGGERYAEGAVALRRGGLVVLVTTSLDDALENVSLVRRRLLLGGAIALAVALGVGYGGAWLFARRIRRLEAAAERIAAGRFDEPVVDDASDELGELARAFERMRERLAQLDNARREFVANASHELRTPLFALGGSLELILEDEMDERTRNEFLATMREQVERLTGLATDLLDLSRADAGRLRIEREPVDLEALARSLVDEFRAVAAAGDRALDAESGAPALAEADPARVLQIGRIFVENALLHTPRGTRVRVRSELRDGRAVLSVVDDGGGIPHEHAGQIFERFYRVDGGVASGSGLGLAIARELARLMGGSVDVDSRPGRTEFVLALPVATPAHDPLYAARSSSDGVFT